MTAVQDPATRAPATPDAEPPALVLTDLVKHFGPVRAVDGVSLTVGRGKVVALVGESGSGKSTVGRCAVRLLEPTAGRVEVGGVDISHLGRRALRRHRREVSIVFQDPGASLDPRMTVGDVVAEPLRLLRLAGSRADRDRSVAAALEQVGLRQEVGRRYPHELSGGQRQRVSIARALVSDPTLLVADEPTSALDVSVQASVLNLVADLQREMGFACLFITHDLSAVEYLADEVAVMYLGQVIESGSRERLFAHPTHPYTQALLSAAPVADPVVQRTRRRVLLTGDIPSPIDPPSGCRFNTRCPAAQEVCRTTAPAYRLVGPPGARQYTSCHFVDEDGKGPEVRVAAGQDRPA